MKTPPRVSFVSGMPSKSHSRLVFDYWARTQEIIDAIRAAGFDDSDVTVEIIDAVALSLGIRPDKNFSYVPE